MRFTVAIITTAAITATAIAVPYDYVIHEKRATPGHRTQRLESDVRLPMRVGLKSNKNARKMAEKWLMDVSHPQSARYGQHWSQEEVLTAFAPSSDTVGAVAHWLTESGGIAKERITHTENKAWITFEATVEEAEGLLMTEYYELEDGKKRMVSCDQYHLPGYLLEHVDYITPGVKGVQLNISKYVQLLPRWSIEDKANITQHRR
jgi:tripeptidyl-peptidase-1